MFGRKKLKIKKYVPDDYIAKDWNMVINKIVGIVLDEIKEKLNQK